MKEFLEILDRLDEIEKAAEDVKPGMEIVVIRSNLNWIIARAKEIEENLFKKEV